VGHSALTPLTPSEEHLPLAIDGRAAGPQAGEALYLMPRHVCPTVNNFDDALLVKLPFDRTIYEDAFSRAMSMRMIERSLVYAEEMADPISSIDGNMCASRHLANAARGAASRRRNERRRSAAGGRHRDR